MKAYKPTLSVLLLAAIVCDPTPVKCATPLSCNDCKVIVASIQKLLQKPTAPDDTDLHPQHGRRGRHRLSEIEIFRAIDGACARAAELHKHILEPCTAFIAKERDLIESFIFGQGTHTLNQFICSRLEPFCDPHVLIDSGEL